MKKILMVDYQGYCDEFHKPIGHSSKVLTEYAALLGNDYRISVAAPLCICSNISDGRFDVLHPLKYEIVEDGKKDLFTRLLDKVKMLFNISQISKFFEYDTIWFYQTDFFFFLYYYFNKPPKQSLCLVYSSNFGQGVISDILKKIYLTSLKKMSRVIYTQKSMPINHPNTMYMPDYYYDEKYEKYRYKNKKEKVVCLGTMNSSKELMKLVEVFNRNEFSLEIVGRFHDTQMFELLQEKAKTNVTIRNEILNCDEYYNLLGEARFSVLPYDMYYYSERTSGVLLESIFVGTIPIAPKLLLDSNDVIGIGYYDLNEVTRTILSQPCGELQMEVNSMVNQYMSKSEIETELRNFLKEENGRN